MYNLSVRWQYLAAFILVVVASGCRSVRTEFPLSEAGVVVSDRSYEGLWQTMPDPVFPNEQPSTLQISLLADDAYKVVWVNGSADNRVVARGKIIDIRGRHYFELEQLEEYRDGDLLSEPAERAMEVSSFYSVSVDSDSLTCSSPEAWSFSTAIKSRNLKYNDADWSTYDILVKSTPEEFAEFLTECHETVFSQNARFRRISVEDLDAHPKGREADKPSTCDIPTANGK